MVAQGPPDRASFDTPFGRPISDKKGLPNGRRAQAEELRGFPGALRRAVAVLAAMALLTALAQVASAEPSTKDQLDAAKAQFERLKDQIAAQQQVVSTLLLEAQRIAERREVAYGEWQDITAQLQKTRVALGKAQDEYQGLQSDLEARARQAYIIGPGSGLEFLLGATSIADLSSRMEYVNALSQEDADLATEVQNLRNTLAAKKQEQERLKAKAAAALARVREQEAALRAKLDEQQAALDQLNAAKARAEELVKKLEQKYQRELEALTGVVFHGGTVFRVCPVDPPRPCTTGSEPRGTEAAIIPTQAMTSSRRRGRPSGRPSRGMHRPVTTAWAETRSTCTAIRGTRTTRT
jgi:peptidoglycan hydrolase CwlO-like protein